MALKFRALVAFTKDQSSIPSTLVKQLTAFSSRESMPSSGCCEHSAYLYAMRHTHINKSNSKKEKPQKRENDWRTLSISQLATEIGGLQQGALAASAQKGG